MPPGTDIELDSTLNVELVSDVVVVGVITSADVETLAVVSITGTISGNGNGDEVIIIIDVDVSDPTIASVVILVVDGTVVDILSVVMSPLGMEVV